jgi:hypothetical protein
MSESFDAFQPVFRGELLGPSRLQARRNCCVGGAEHELCLVL